MTEVEEKMWEERIKALPLEEAFPQADYNALLKQGVEPIRVALAHALRDEIRPKPALTGRLSVGLFDPVSAEYWESGDIECVRRDVLDRYTEEVKVNLTAADWVLSGGRIEHEVFDAVTSLVACKSEDEFVSLQRKNRELLCNALQAQAKARVCELLLPLAESSNLRVALYNRYGHDVSFKPLRVFFPDDRAEEAAVYDADVLERNVAEGYRTERHGGFAPLFSQGELDRLVQSPQIRQWYEDELERSRGQDKEEELEERTCEDDYSMAY